MKAAQLRWYCWAASGVLLLTWISSAALATIPYGGLSGGIPGGLGSGLANSDVVPGKEYSHDIDHTTTGGGGVSDPEQVIAWDGSGGTADGLDYTGTRGPNFPGDEQADAIANRRDHLFNELIGSDNVPDRAHLIFSHDNQISRYPGPIANSFSPLLLSPALSGGPFTLANGKQIGGTGELSYELAGAFSPPSTQGIWATQAEINGMPNPVDVDGVELWGPEPAVTADAEKYSLEVDFFTDVSVWSLDLGTNASTPYVTHNQIVNAVTALLGPVPNGAVLPYPTFIDGDDAINVDALMVQDIIDDGVGPDTFDRDPANASGDRIIFSIRQIMNDQDPDGYYATGSEIFVLDATQPNNPTFLVHGGHTWDHAYALNNLRVSPNIMEGGLAIIDINAIEAISAEVIPEPTSAMLLCIGFAAVANRRFARSSPHRRTIL